MLLGKAISSVEEEFRAFQYRFYLLQARKIISAVLICIGSQVISLLDITPEVRIDLKEKHPKGKDTKFWSNLQGPLNWKLAEDVLFEHLDTEAIYKAAKSLTLSLILQ